MAYGLKPVRHLGGGVIRTNAMGSYSIASGYGTNIFRGDPVKRAADGTLVRGAASDATTTGVFWGVTYKDTNTGEYKYSPYWPASTVATEIAAEIYDDPKIVFQVEADQLVTPLVAADIGAYVDLIIGAGSLVTKNSGAAADSSTVVSTILTVKVLGSAETDSTFGAAGVATDIYVVFAEHEYNQFPTVA